MLPTPKTENLPATVYPPSEDSYLLLDTVSASSESSFLSSRFPTSSPSPFILEVGTGSGLVLAFITAHSQHVLGRSDTFSVGVDLNCDACSAARRTAKLACTTAQNDAKELNQQDNAPAYQPGNFLDTVQSDLVSAIRPKSVDILIFNPPYVPTDEVPERPAESSAANGSASPTQKLSTFELESVYLDIAVSGGPDGMQVTNRLLAALDGVLSDNGVAYVLFSVRNRPKHVMQRLQNDGWDVIIAGTTGRTGGIERLLVLRIARSCA